MPTRKKWRKAWNRNYAVLTLCVAVSVIALIYSLPRESKFGYIYELDKPWRYQQLIASYDFPVVKTEAELQRERDSTAASFEPYYAADSLTGEKQVAALQADFSRGQFKNLPAYYLPRLVQLLRETYSRGIVDAAELAQLRQENKQTVRLIKGKMSTTVSTADLLTTRDAYNRIIHQDEHSLPPGTLRSCGLNKYLVPNLRADAQKNKQELDAQLAQILANCGMVQSGQLIIDRGQIVTAQHVKILDSLKKESERRMDPSRGYWFIFGGQAVYVLVCVGLLLLYLKLFRRDYLTSPHCVLLIFSLTTLFPVVTNWMMGHNFYSVYLVPYAIVPIFVRVFIDSRTAFMALLVTTLLSALTLHNPFEFVLLQIVTGVTAIYSLRELTERAQLLKTVLYVVGAGLLVSFTYDLAQGLGARAFDQSRTVYVVIGGILLLFAYPLMYLVEKLFGFTSSVTLIELTNINNSLLRRMSKVAQGTFNHSMQVANLAAEVADKIGAKPQLVRTGALYHDIGKILNPAFFTENQSGVNPHDQLSEERSAQIIVSHVTDGLRLADKHHLPAVIKDFIRTHHGAGMAKYFYINYVNKHPGEEVDKALFSYPGPNPQTREQAILMMCDAVEAASRSLKEYTEESIGALVERIVEGQLADGCFRECPLTFRDIADAKRVLVDSLKTIYHTRISYPEMNKPQAELPPEPQGFFGTGIHHTWRR